MTFETNLMRVMSVLLVSGLSLAACGDGEDGPTSGEQSAGSGGEDGETGGTTSKGGSSASGSGSGGKAPGTGGATGATGGKAGTPSGDCETASDPIEHCYAENDDRPGTAVCSEYYAAGVAMLFCTEPEPGGCPRNDELAAACIGGLTSSYYYADSGNAGFWDAGEGGCEVNAGAWCTF
jgi:hypothetical protein